MLRRLCPFAAGLVFAATTAAGALPLVAVDVSPAEAGIQSNRPDFTPGGTLVVHIVVDGLESVNPLNAFQLDLTFNDLTFNVVLSPQNPTLGDLVSSAMVVGTPVVSGSLVSFAAVIPGAGGVVEDVDLDMSGVIEPEEDVIGTLLVIEFVTNGPSALTLGNVILSAPFGQQIANVETQDGFVPEPSAALLLAAGAAALAAADAARRSRQVRRGS